MQELQCFKCGYANNFGNKFCTNCGEKFQYSCPKCSSIIDPGVKFCGICAAELDWGLPAQIPKTQLPAEKQDDEKQQFKETELSPVHQEKPKRHTLPFVIITVLLVVCIVAIFAVDIFLKS